MAVTNWSKKTSEDKKSKNRSASKQVGRRIRGPYMRREERLALLKAHPYCRVIDYKLVECLKCGSEIKLDCRPKSLSAPTGGYYASNWRKHWLTHLRDKDVGSAKQLTRAKKPEEKEFLTGTVLENHSIATSPLFLPDPDYERGFGHDEPLGLGSWMLTDSNENIEAHPSESEPPTNEFASGFDELKQGQAGMHSSRGVAAFFEMCTDSETDPRPRGFFPQEWTDQSMTFNDEQIAAARILMNLSRGN